MSCNTYMSYNTYVINMADSTKRWDQISKHLDDIGINYSRFDAIDGNNIENKYDEYLTFAKPITPNSVIGCGLSHFLATKQHFENNDNPKEGLFTKIKKNFFIDIGKKEVREKVFFVPSHK